MNCTPKGKPNSRYIGEFKKKVIEDMRKNSLGYSEAIRKYKKIESRLKAKLSTS